MFSRKFFFSLLSVVLLSASMPSLSIAGAAGRTLARTIGHTIGFGLGAIAGTNIKVNSVPDYSTQPTLKLELDRAILRTTTNVETIRKTFDQMDIQQAGKALAPLAVSLGIALCTRGKIKPLAIGAIAGAGCTSGLIPDSVVHDPTQKALTDYCQNVSKLVKIETELALRTYIKDK